MKHISWTRNQACVCREVSSMRQMTHSRSQNGWGCHFYRKHVVLQFDACRASFWFTIIFAFIGNMMLIIWWACVLRNKKFLNAKCLGKFLYLISKYKISMALMISTRHYTLIKILRNSSNIWSLDLHITYLNDDGRG